MRTKHFKLAEFRCRCGCTEDVPDATAGLMCLLELCRNYVEKPLVVNSGWRCEQHNMEVGGTGGSWHLKGLAADIDKTNLTETDHAAFLFFAKKQLGLHVIEYETHWHVDARNLV